MPNKKDELLSKFSNFLDENLKEETNQPLNLSSIDNGIKLVESIDNILAKEGSNNQLVSFVTQYKNAIADGCREEMLYETFTQGLGQFGYLRAVDTELSALKERIGKAKQNIDLTKILEIMNNTTSYYIVPLIESDVVDYMKEKTPNKRVLLIHHLNTFQHDPYVRQIINCVNLDNELPGLMVSESLEYGANTKAHTEKVYSPVQYIRENECVFNVNNTFYIKKGNHVSKLAKDNIGSLNESFVALCQLVNDPRVEITDDFIMLYHKNNIVKINESEAIINCAAPESKESLRRLNEMYVKYDNYDTELYVMSSLLLENFNKIAEVPFVKHISLNESEDLSLDLFKIKNNIFITTHNNVLRQHTFYRNVNPIQCANIINEHLNIEAEALFEDLMPNQDKIKKDLKETKEAYEERIKALKEKKEELESVMSEADDEESIKAALADIDSDIEDTEKEYKEWQEQADKFSNGDEADSETDSLSDKYKEEDDETSKDDIVSIEKDDETEEDNLEEPLSDTPEFEEEPIAEPAPEPASQEQATESNERFQIVRVDFAKNLKTGEQSNTGNVIVIVPMVDSDGNLVSETQTIQFYVDNEGKIILNNTGMTAELYTSILNAIETDPRKNEINSNSYGADTDGDFNNPMENSSMEGQALEKPVPEENIDDVPEDFFEEKPAPSGISRWLPKDENALAEAKLITGLAGQFTLNESKKKLFLNKSGVLNEAYDNVLNSALEVPEPEDEVLPDDNIDNSEFVDDDDNRTALEKIQNAAESYIDDENPDAEVTDVDTEDTNFSAIKYFTFRINDNDWAFFEFNNKIYSVQKDTFLDALDACGSSEEFGDFLSDNEEVESVKAEASTQELINLLTDVISVETGEQFSFDDSSDKEDEDMNESIKVRIKKDSDKKDNIVDLTGTESLKDEEAKEGSEEEQESEEEIKKAKEESEKKEEEEKPAEETSESGKPELPKIRLKKINEAASPIPLIPEPNDTVEFKGKRGVVQSVNADGTLTLMVEGMTIDCSPREVKITTNRVDTMKAPFKYDPKTLAALYEQWIPCGIYQSGVRVTADTCAVNYAEYERKKDYQNVTVINEGARILIPKKNVKLFEDVNSFANVDDYIEGVYLNGNQASSNILINAVDYSKALAGNEPIRCIVDLESEKPRVVELPKDTIRTLAV